MMMVSGWMFSWAYETLYPDIRKRNNNTENVWLFLYTLPPYLIQKYEDILVIGSPFDFAQGDRE